MPARLVVLGILNIVLAALGLLMCGAILLASFGFGTIIALSSFENFGAGLMLGSFGAFVSLIGVLLCIAQAYIGALIMQGRALGFVGGLVISALCILSFGGGDWLHAAFGVFGLWALLTSRESFR